MDIIALYTKEAAKKFRKLSREEENRLILKAKQGDIQARNQILERHLLLVIKLARYYDAALEDLIFEGNMAILRAIEEFDVHYGTRFITYAGVRVKNAMQNLTAKEKRRKRYESTSTEKLHYIKGPNGILDAISASNIIEKAPLTKRERFVIKKRIQGFKIKEIAMEIGISRQAVGLLNKNAMRKIKSYAKR